MTSRRQFLATFAALLPLPAAAQAPWGVVHELVGDVTLNDFPLTRQSALQAGQTIRTGADGRVWFSIGTDAYFLRPNSRLRLDASRSKEPIIDFLRLVTGALGATFARGTRRTLIAPTAAHAQNAARAYKDINLLAFKLLTPGGLLATFSRSGGVDAHLFQSIVAGAALDAGAEAKIIERYSAAADHPVALQFPEGEYLKGLLVLKT